MFVFCKRHFLVYFIIYVLRFELTVPLYYWLLKKALLPQINIYTLHILQTFNLMSIHKLKLKYSYHFYIIKTTNHNSALLILAPHNFNLNIYFFQIFTFYIFFYKKLIETNFYTIIIIILELRLDFRNHSLHHASHHFLYNYKLLYF